MTESQFEKVLITVVTINYNNLLGLQQTIRSVQSQTGRKAIEFIVIDGNSTDGSAEYLRSNSGLVDEFLIEPDSGIFDAMNKGVELAQGDYIYFLNSGDVFFSQYVIHSVVEIARELQDNFLGIQGKVDIYYKEKYIGIADPVPWPCHQSVFLKTEVMKSFRFDSSLQIFGDLDLWRRIKRVMPLFFHQVNDTIACMELDGVGVHPTFFLRRARDKLFLVRDPIEFLKFVIGLLWETIGYIVYAILGEKVYFTKFIDIKRKLKVMLRLKKAADL